MSDELRALRNALDDLMVAAQAVIEDSVGLYVSPASSANWHNLSDAVEGARTLLYNPHDSTLNMSIEEMRQEVDRFDAAARLAEEGM